MRLDSDGQAGSGGRVPAMLIFVARARDSDGRDKHSQDAWESARAIMAARPT
jgi:hypothetical protein